MKTFSLDDEIRRYSMEMMKNYSKKQDLPKAEETSAVSEKFSENTNKKDNIDSKTPTDAWNDFTENNPAAGILRIQALSANSSFPVENAVVNVFKSFPQGDFPIAELTTDQSGQTENITLPAPPKSFSQTPDGEKPFALYTILISHPDYIPVRCLNQAVFSDTVSLQIVNLLPTGTSPKDEIVVNSTPPAVL